MILLPLILLLAPPASTTTLTLDNPSFPSTQAKKMIRDFNLSPEREINIVEDDGGLRLSSVQQNSIVEKRFKFPKFTDPNGASVADLGHHAGYYQIKHSHAARYVIEICLGVRAIHIGVSHAHQGFELGIKVLVYSLLLVGNYLSPNFVWGL